MAKKSLGLTVDAEVRDLLHLIASKKGCSISRLVTKWALDEEFVVDGKLTDGESYLEDKNNGKNNN